MCAEPDCNRPCWASEKRGRLVVHSVYCKAHSHIALFDVPTESVPQRVGRQSAAAVFRAEVERQRLARERSVFRP
jgi:hypothetical protein